MKFLVLLAVFALVTVGILSIPGCGGSSTDPAGPVATGDDHAGHQHDPVEDLANIKMELALLSVEDATAVQKQSVCPVSGEKLGTMGAPLKVEVKGQQVWICCDGCKDAVLASPDKFLAKLKKE
ncbi:MAG: YHS domain-containing protein [Pirellulaceae bacterium]|jgi:YHS domain-containing protein